MNFSKRIKVAVAVIALCFSNTTFAGTGDTSIALLSVSGSVPEVFSVTARGLPGDLDLTPNVIVNNRLIGILKFKFNQNAASITVGGVIGGVGYTFATPPTLSATGCTAVTMANEALAAADHKSVLAGALVATGIEEDCPLSASWVGTASALPLAGIVTLNITVTMVAL